MRSKLLARCAPLALALVAACSTPSAGGGSNHDGAAAGVMGGAGTTGGGGTTGAAGTGGGGGEPLPDGGAGTTGAAGTMGTAGTAGTAGGGGSAAANPDGAVSDGAASDGAPAEAGIPHKPFTGTVKIMVLGSSNEEGTCWRAFLWKKLRDAGVTNFDFVGRNNAGPDCGVAGYDKDSEAHGGTVVSNISADAWLTTFKANPSDIILQHNGGADLLNGRPYADVIKAYTLSVNQVRMVNPNVIYFAAQHTPQGSAGDVKNVVDLNAAMVPWAAGLTTAASPLVIVDLFTGIDQKTDMSDGTHLNVAGSEKVSDRFLAVLLPLLKP